MAYANWCARCYQHTQREGNTSQNSSQEPHPMPLIRGLDGCLQTRWSAHSFTARSVSESKKIFGTQTFRQRCILHYFNLAIKRQNEPSRDGQIPELTMDRPANRLEWWPGADWPATKMGEANRDLYLEVVTTDEDLLALRADWDALHEAMGSADGPRMNPFTSWTFFWEWW